MKEIDKNTRFFIDLDLNTKRIINWDYEQRDKISQELSRSNNIRIFITKGQYNKLDKYEEN